MQWDAGCLKALATNFEIKLVKKENPGRVLGPGKPHSKS